MSDDKLEKIETGLTELIKEVSSLVGEFKWYRKEVAELKVSIKDQDTRIRDVETKMPSLQEMKDNHNKIRNSVVAAITFSVIIGALIARYAGS